MKKKALISTILGISAGVIITPVVATTVVAHVSQDNTTYKFQGKTFNTKKELYDYALDNATKEKSIDRVRHSWSINWGGQVKYFDDVNDLMNFLDEKIITHKGTASTDIDLGEYGEVPSSQLYKLNLDKTPNQIKVYRGRNNSIFKTEKDAKNSYLEIHDTYQFNNLFFRDKEELHNYLILNKDAIKNNSDYVVIISPDNLMSTPISITKLNDGDEETLKYIKNFVSDCATKYIQVHDPKTNKYYYYDKNEIYTQIGNISTIVENYSKVALKSNQGMPNYIVDLNKEDPYNLYGPYYLKSTAALQNITNPDCWKQISSDEINIVTNQQQVDLLSKFMESIMVDYTLANPKNPKPTKAGEIATPINIDLIKTETQTYFKKLNDEAPSVYKEIMGTFNKIKDGKRYSTFYKLPILYIETIECLIKTCASQNLIDETNTYYKLVTSKFDDALYALVPTSWLRNKNNPNDLFSFTNLFKFGDPNFDLNTTMDGFTDIIISNYPQLLDFITFFGYTVYTSAYLWDAMPFDKEFIKKYFNIDLSTYSSEQVTDLGTCWKMLTTGNKKQFDDACKATYQHNIRELKLDTEIDPRSLDALDYVFVFKRYSARQTAQKEFKENLDMLKKAKNDSDLKGIVNEKNSLLYDANGNIWFAKQIRDSGLLDQFYNGSLSIVDFLRMKYLYKEGLLPGNLSSYSTSEIDKLFIKSINSSKFKTLNDIANEFKNIIVMCETEYSLLPLTQKELESSEYAKNSLCEEFCNLTNEIVGQFSDIYNAISSLMDVFGVDLKKLSPVFPVLEGILYFLDMLIPKYEYFSYMFETDNAKFIWDGGMKATMFWGYLTVDSRDVSDMKLIPPQQITEPCIADGIYYNGKIYDPNEDGWKKDQLYDIMEGRYHGNPDIKEVWTFKPLPDMVSESPAPDAYDSIDTLYNHVLESIKSGGDFIDTKKVYKYANGFSLDGGAAINDVLDNIKPTKVATIPTLQNNYPIVNDESEVDNSLPNYVLPQTSWTSAHGESVNTTNNKYIIVDPNVLTKTSTYVASDSDIIIDATSILTQQFYDSFDVPSKTIVENDLLNINKYSHLSNNIRNLNVYEVKLDYGYSRYFLDKGDALKWYLVKQDFAVQDSFISQIKYVYDGMTFNDYDSFLKWVTNNMEVING